MELKSESTLQHLNNYVAGEVNVAFAKMALSLTFSYPQGTTAAWLFTEISGIVLTLQAD